MPAVRGVGTRGGTTASFFEALHYFTVHNITWRALPAEFGSWNSIWKRFWRLSRSGVFETFFEALASLSERAHLVQMFDSTVIRAHVSAAGAKGGRMAKHSGAPEEASRPRSISRPISTVFEGARNDPGRGCGSHRLCVPGSEHKGLWRLCFPGRQTPPGKAPIAGRLQPEMVR